MKLENKRVHLIFEDFDHVAALGKMKDLPPEGIIQAVKDSGLRGRGGAGFPTGLKWESVALNEAPKKYVICNADEGEPGTFKDREILQRQAGKVLFGMTSCAVATGAAVGFIYLRGEYNYLLPDLRKAVEAFNQYISNETLAECLERNGNETKGFKQDWEIGEQTCSINIKKISF